MRIREIGRDGQALFCRVYFDNAAPRVSSNPMPEKIERRFILRFNLGRQ